MGGIEDSDLSIEELADGLALWEEHKPQTGEDWLAVAERCAADPGYEIEKSHVLLQAAVLAVRKYGGRAVVRGDEG